MASWSSLRPPVIQRLREEGNCEIATSAPRGVGVRESSPDPLRDRDSGSGVTLSPSMLLVSIALPSVPVKPFCGAYGVSAEDCRIFNCGRCHREVVICRRCDRGHRYCPPCAPRARAEKQRAAGAVYQKTEAGRVNHKVRQECYRARQAEKETHHGDIGAALRGDCTVATLRGGQENPDEHRKEPPPPRSRPQRRCDFCGRPCRGAVRRGPVPRRPSLGRRGPRLPGWRPARRRC